MAERPGPVHITTPADVVGAEAHGCDPFASAAKDACPLRPGVRGGRRGGGRSGARARRAPAGRARRHRRAARRRRSRARAAAEKLGLPVVVSPMAKGVLPEDHPYFAGTLDMACNEVVWSFLKGCDLLLAVGFDAVELIKPWPLACRRCTSTRRRTPTRSIRRTWSWSATSPRSWRRSSRTAGRAELEGPR